VFWELGAYSRPPQNRLRHRRADEAVVRVVAEERFACANPFELRAEVVGEGRRLCP
jgi:hypothetical protein